MIYNWKKQLIMIYSASTRRFMTLRVVEDSTAGESHLVLLCGFCILFLLLCCCCVTVLLLFYCCCIVLVVLSLYCFCCFVVL